MVFVEGTTNLPRDNGGRYFAGTLGPDGLFWSPRSDGNKSLQVALWGPNNAALFTTSNPGQHSSIGQNTTAFDNIVTYLANASANTSQQVDITLPATSHPSALSYLAIANPSTASALTLSFQNKEIFNGTGSPVTHYAEVSTATIAANKPEGLVFMVQGWLLGYGGRLVIKNSSTIENANVIVSIIVRRV